VLFGNPGSNPAPRGERFVASAPILPGRAMSGLAAASAAARRHTKADLFIRQAVLADER